MHYTVIDPESYYRKGPFRHFTQDCKCSISMTGRVDVTDLYARSKADGTRFYTNFLYLLCRVVNSRPDYRMGYLYQTDQLVVFDVMNPIQFAFHKDTETCSPVYTEYDQDYALFSARAEADLARAEKTRECVFDLPHHLNWFDASYLPWFSYDALHIELPDGHLHFPPIVNWGRFREENGRLMMPVTVRLNHAAADGYLLAKAFLLLEEEMARFCARNNG